MRKIIGLFSLLLFSAHALSDETGKCANLAILDGKYSLSNGKVFTLDFTDQKIDFGEGTQKMSSCWYEPPKPCCPTDVSIIYIQAQFPEENGGNSMMEINTELQEPAKGKELAFPRSDIAKQPNYPFGYKISSLKNNQILDSGEITFQKKVTKLSLYEQYVGANESQQNESLIVAGKCQIYSKVKSNVTTKWSGKCKNSFATGEGVMRYFDPSKKLIAIGKDVYENGYYQSSKDAYFLNDGKIMQISKTPSQPATEVSEENIPIWAKDILKNKTTKPAMQKSKAIKPQAGGSSE